MAAFAERAASRAMRSRLPVFFFACAAAFLAPGARAQSALTSGDPLVEARETRAWLARIQGASEKRNYAGTLLVSAGGTVTSSRIAHYCAGRDQLERIDALDGPQRNVYRHNELVHTVWPKRRVAVVEQRDALNSFPALLQAGSDHVEEYYELKPAGVERVAGHEANVLMLRARDGLRYGYRLWTDQSTGLLLREEVLGERGETLESSAFSDLVIGVAPQADSVLQPIKNLDGYQVLRRNQMPVRLESEGWMLKAAVPGFRLVSCVRQALDGGLHSLADADEPALHAVYSDGLTYVSIFIEPYVAERHRRAMSTAIGATQTLMRREGDWWVTTMGDVPAATLRRFAHAIERKTQ